MPIIPCYSSEKDCARTSVPTRLPTFFPSSNVVLKGAAIMAVWGLVACNSTPLDMQPGSGRKDALEPDYTNLLEHAEALRFAEEREEIKKDGKFIEHTHPPLTPYPQYPAFWDSSKSTGSPCILSVARKLHADATTTLSEDFHTALWQGQARADQMIQAITRTLRRIAWANALYVDSKVVRGLECARSLAMDHMQQSHQKYAKNALERVEAFQQTIAHLIRSHQTSFFRTLPNANTKCPVCTSVGGVQHWHIDALEAFRQSYKWAEVFSKRFCDKLVWKFTSFIDNHPAAKEFDVERTKQDALALLSINTDHVLRAYRDFSKTQTGLAQAFAKCTDLISQQAQLQRNMNYGDFFWRREQEAAWRQNALQNVVYALAKKREAHRLLMQKQRDRIAQEKQEAEEALNKRREEIEDEHFERKEAEKQRHRKAMCRIRMECFEVVVAQKKQQNTAARDIQYKAAALLKKRGVDFSEELEKAIEAYEQKFRLVCDQIKTQIQQEGFQSYCFDGFVCSPPQIVAKTGSSQKDNRDLFLNLLVFDHHSGVAREGSSYSVLPGSVSWKMA